MFSVFCVFLSKCLVKRFYYFAYVFPAFLSCSVPSSQDHSTIHINYLNVNTRTYHNVIPEEKLSVWRANIRNDSADCMLFTIQDLLQIRSGSQCQNHKHEDGTDWMVMTFLNVTMLSTNPANIDISVF